MYNLARTCVKSRFPRLGAPIPSLDGFLHDTVLMKYFVRAMHDLTTKMEERALRNNVMMGVDYFLWEDVVWQYDLIEKM